MKKSIVFSIATNRRKIISTKIKKEQNTGTKTIKKIGKVTYEVVVHFNENATETMQDQLKRIMLREMEREKHQKDDKND